jgi:hypothetical protein
VPERGGVDCAGAGVTRPARGAEGDRLAALRAGRGAGIARVRRPGLDGRLAGRAGHPYWLRCVVLGHSGQVPGQGLSPTVARRWSMWSGSRSFLGSNRPSLAMACVPYLAACLRAAGPGR